MPFLIGTICEILFQTALKKLSSVSYEFDTSTGITTWVENNQKKSYIKNTGYQMSLIQKAKDSMITKSKVF